MRLAGDAYGAKSPVVVSSRTFYLDAQLEAGAKLEFPDEHEERACYVVTGEVSVEGERFGERSLLGARNGAKVTVEAVQPTRLMLLGGESLGERFIDWNFVSSSQQRLEKARADWKERRFPIVPGDELEFIPLPEKQV
jgi:redox-sensitive bicupin YhaK (pirin superfamily)